MPDLTYKLIRSKRRTICLVITKEAVLEVRAPFKASMYLIEKFIAKKRSWIEKKKDLVNKRRERNLPKEFVDGEEFLYEGNVYRLKICDCENITISDVLHFPKKFLSQAKQRLITWYKNRALEKITERINHHASINQFKYKSIKVTSAKKRWGSCSFKGSLNFSWRLIMAYSDILDYVVVHELVHLVEMNHSKSFWGMVQKILPDYKKQKDWLRQNGDRLSI